MNKSWRILLVIVLAAMVLAACGGPNYTLYGTWRNEETDLVLIFQQNGHLLIQQQGAIQNVLFEFSTPGTIKLKPFEAAPENQTSVLSYSIAGDKLTLAQQSSGQESTPPGQAQVLTRVK